MAEEDDKSETSQGEIRKREQKAETQGQESDDPWQDRFREE